MQTEFLAIDVTVSEYDPRSSTDRDSLFRLLQSSPAFPYVELTDGNVTFVNDPFTRDPSQRIRIEPQESDEFNTEDVLMILTMSKLFFYEHAWIHGHVANRLHAGIVLAHDGSPLHDSLYVMGETLASLRGDLAP